MSNQFSFDSNNPSTFIPMSSISSKSTDNSSSSSLNASNNTSSSTSSTPNSSRSLFTNHHSATLLNTNTQNKQFKYSPNITNDSAEISANQISSTSNPTIQYYLIAYGQIKPKLDESAQLSFISRYDSDGKFTYVEPR